MTAAFSILATITVQHDYYADGRCRDFDIVPAADTRTLLQGLEIIYKMVDNVLLLLMKTDEKGLPDKTLPAGARLSFYLMHESPSLPNFTALPPTIGDGQSIFYFGNDVGSVVEGARYLHPGPALYAPGETYAIGDIVRNAGGEAFEAIRPGKGHATSKSEYWSPLPGKSYAHASSVARITDGRYTTVVPAPGTYNVTIMGQNALTGAFDVAFEPRTVTAAEPSKPFVPEGDDEPDMSDAIITAEVDLKGLPAGAYEVNIDGDPASVYLDAAATYNRAWGIITMLTSFNAAHPYGLFDVSGKPRGLDHVIRFASRSVIWKYVIRNASLTGITDTSATAAFTKNEEPLYIASKKPLPLRQTPLKTLQLMKGAAVIRNALANPTPDFLSMHTDGNNETFFCATTYLNL